MERKQTIYCVHHEIFLRYIIASLIIGVLIIVNVCANNPTDKKSELFSIKALFTRRERVTRLVLAHFFFSLIYATCLQGR